MNQAKSINTVYYTLKPFIPRQFQLWLRRKIVLRKRKRYLDVWPIDPSAGKPPGEWTGWPSDKQFALVLTHDVDTAWGQEKCLKLMDIEIHLGFRSSFNFVTVKYDVSEELRYNMTNNVF